MNKGFLAIVVVVIAIVVAVLVIEPWSDDQDAPQGSDGDGSTESPQPVVEDGQANGTTGEAEGDDPSDDQVDQNDQDASVEGADDIDDQPASANIGEDQQGDVVDDDAQSGDVVNDLVTNDDAQSGDVVDDEDQSSDVVDDVVQSGEIVDDEDQSGEVVDGQDQPTSADQSGGTNEAPQTTESVGDPHQDEELDDSSPSSANDADPAESQSVAGDEPTGAPDETTGADTDSEPGENLDAPEAPDTSGDQSATDGHSPGDAASTVGPDDAAVGQDDEPELSDSGDDQTAGNDDQSSDATSSAATDTPDSGSISNDPSVDESSDASGDPSSDESADQQSTSATTEPDATSEDAATPPTDVPADQTDVPDTTEQLDDQSLIDDQEPDGSGTQTETADQIDVTGEQASDDHVTTADATVVDETIGQNGESSPTEVAEDVPDEDPTTTAEVGTTDPEQSAQLITDSTDEHATEAMVQGEVADVIAPTTPVDGRTEPDDATADIQDTTTDDAVPTHDDETAASTDTASDDGPIDGRTEAIDAADVHDSSNAVTVPGRADETAASTDIDNRAGPVDGRTEPTVSVQDDPETSPVIDAGAVVPESPPVDAPEIADPVELADSAQPDSHQEDGAIGLTAAVDPSDREPVFAADELDDPASAEDVETVVPDSTSDDTVADATNLNPLPDRPLKPDDAEGDDGAEAITPADDTEITTDLAGDTDTAGAGHSTTDQSDSIAATTVDAQTTDEPAIEEPAANVTGDTTSDTIESTNLSATEITPQEQPLTGSDPESTIVTADDPTKPDDEPGLAPSVVDTSGDVEGDLDTAATSQSTTESELPASDGVTESSADGETETGADSDRTAADDSAPRTEDQTVVASAESFDTPSNMATESPNSATTRSDEDLVTPERSIGPDRPNTTGGPAFDVIRVSGDGSMILAGTAEPLATVIIMDGETVLGEEIADIRGDWIFMPFDPLSPGNHQIGAMLKQPNGTLVPSSDLVLVVVPLRGTDIAGRENERADQPLVMLVPRDGGPATVVVQSPDPDAPLDQGLDQTEIADAGTDADDAREGGGVVFSRPSLPDAAPSDNTVRATESDASDQPEMGDDSSVGDVALIEPAEQADPFDPDANSGGDLTDSDDADNGDAPVVFSRPTLGADTEDDSDGSSDVAADSDMSIDVIDYDQQGDISFSGDAEAGAIVQVYLDNAVMGVTEASPSGSWQLTPDQAVPPGPHQIRIDQIAPSGDVIARIELPFERAEAVTGMPQDVFVVVEPGNSLWRIARRVYGDGIRYTEILAANKGQIADPNLIYPGQVFMIPRG